MVICSSRLRPKIERVCLCRFTAEHIISKRQSAQLLIVLIGLFSEEMQLSGLHWRQSYGGCRLGRPGG
jgi:hypothetical protein